MNLLISNKPTTKVRSQLRRPTEPSHSLSVLIYQVPVKPSVGFLNDGLEAEVLRGGRLWQQGIEGWSRQAQSKGI